MWPRATLLLLVAVTIAAAAGVTRVALLLRSCLKAKQRLLDSSLPGPPLPSVVPIGHVPALLGARNAWTVDLWVRTYGRVLKFQLLDMAPVVMLTDLPTIGRITRRTGPGPYMPKPHAMYKMLEASCSPSRPSLITSPDNAHHRAVRAATAACFSISNLKKVVPLVLELSERVAERMRHHALFDVTDGAKRITSDVMGQLLYGEDLGGTRWTSSEYLDVFFTVLKAQACLVSNPLYLWMLWSPEVRLVRRCMAAHNRLMAATVQRLRAHPPAEHTIAAHIMAAVDPATGRPLDDFHVRAEISTFTAAGFETTSHGITWCLTLLAAHPDIQEQVFDELAAARLTQRGFEASDWGRLPLLAAVIKEALRLCPPVPFGGCRHVVTPGGAELCGHHVPQGTLVMFPLLSIGTAKHSYGPDALEFKPQRWMAAAAAEGGEGGDSPTTTAAAASGLPDPLTFMTGPRDCIGQNLAKLELQVVLATLLRRFRFGPGPELARELGVAAATGQPPVTAVHALAGVHITLQPLSGRMELALTPR